MEGGEGARRGGGKEAKGGRGKGGKEGGGGGRGEGERETERERRKRETPATHCDLIESTSKGLARPRESRIKDESNPSREMRDAERLCDGEYDVLDSLPTIFRL